MSTGERRLRLREAGVEWRVLEDETVVLDLDGARYFAANRTGTVLWPLLAQGTTRSALVQTVTHTWGLDVTQAEHDVDAFCARLRDAGLLED